MVSNSKLHVKQTRSNRLLPGVKDSTQAACFMIGGTADSTRNALLAKMSPCDLEDYRFKAVEHVFKGKTLGGICACNGEQPSVACADNSAALRICQIVADILGVFSAPKVARKPQCAASNGVAT